MDNKELYSEIYKSLDQVFEKGRASDLIGQAADKVLLNYKWTINNRWTTKLGMASWKRIGGDIVLKTLQCGFSSKLLTTNPHLIYPTVSHEVAHLIDVVMRGTSGHDKTWKNIDLILGGNGKRLQTCKGVERKRKWVKRWEVIDIRTNRVHIISTTIYNRLKRHNLLGRYKLMSTFDVSPNQQKFNIQTFKE